MTLKTLKDIKPKFTVGTDLVATDMLKEQLREEAIKWLKTPNDLMSGLTVEWIKHFFNITEDDLK